ncbi:crustin 4 [Penaeus vannamei]|uniref:Crustin 4 n=1 Tax=Penaeus vannamei TaxID=6689 RepID=A0A3R7SQE2_PENVA|nr:crustin 4 [Penaeus vannamei]
MSVAPFQLHQLGFRSQKGPRGFVLDLYISHHRKHQSPVYSTVDHGQASKGYSGGGVDGAFGPVPSHGTRGSSGKRRLRGTFNLLRRRFGRSQRQRGAGRRKPCADRIWSQLCNDCLGHTRVILKGGGFNQWQYNDGYYNPGYQYQKNCARYCPGSAPGSYVCCVRSHPNEPQCPPTRPTCTDPFYYSGPPQRCENSYECMSSSLCCYDTCLQHKTCKPAQYG